MQRDATDAERERLTNTAQSSSQDLESGLQIRAASHTGKRRSSAEETEGIPGNIGGGGG